MAHVVVLGGTGVYARHLIPRLAAAGHHVRALVRRVEAAGVARACGAEVGVADIFDQAGLRAGLEGGEVCVNLATSLPGPSGRGDWAVNDRVRREGVPRLIAACREAGVPRLLQQSIAWADEPVAPGPGQDVAATAIAAVRDMEAAVRSSGLDWLILRGALFYGPGTGLDDDWFARAAAGRLRLPGDGSDHVSLVHIADMAAATVAALRAWPSRETIAVADDAPVRWRDLFGHVAALTGAEPPQPGGRRGFPPFRIGNQRARQLLGWAPAYGDHRAGLAR